MSTLTDKPVDTVSIEIDGVELQAPKGSMVIEAADKAGIAIPRFCYHEKLSIAANCRMCLVDVEKAPKPMPACATPVADGMKVFTASRRAADAQRAVMEFLLINHPLDCPICDQGGECELQDMAMGYGRSVSRFSERKRVVPDEDLGSLVSTDMTRCIQCTRCVRFLEEISGTHELGGIGRGEHLEIKTWVGRSIESELGGNIIDLCPVGALTNKPFRFRARAWELSARPGVAIHDALGSGYYAHVMRGKVYRVVPRANEAINESWLSDRDRWSSEGLYHSDRLQQPQIKIDGQWQDASWEQALETALSGLRGVPGDQLGVLAGGNVSTEEYFLLQKLMRATGCNNLDHRLDELDFSNQDQASGMPALGMPLADIQAADSILLVGSNPRHEAPILGHRVRQAWRQGARVDAINPVSFDFNFELSCERVVGPWLLAAELAAVAKALGSSASGALGQAISRAETGDDHQAIADALKQAQRPVLVLGHLSATHPEASWLRALATEVASLCDGQVASLPTQANAAGAWAAGMLPHRGPGAQSAGPGRHARDLLENGAKGFVLYQTEPALDSALGSLAQEKLEQAEFVLAFSSFDSPQLRAAASVILPIGCGIEIDGTWINAFGDVAEQSAGAHSPGQSRPGWRALRVMGNLMDLEGFDYQTIDEIQAELAPLIEAARNHSAGGVEPSAEPAHAGGIARIASRPIYASDALVRRSTALQSSPLGCTGFCGLNRRTAEKLGVAGQDQVMVSQNGNSVVLPLKVMDEVADDAAWIPTGVQASAQLGLVAGSVDISTDGSQSADGGASNA